MKFFESLFKKSFRQFHSSKQKSGALLSQVGRAAINYFTQPGLYVFLLSVGYHLSLYLSTSNTTLLFLTAIYFLLIYKKTGNLGHTLLLVFITTLPFAKGKGLQIISLPKELIPRYALFKISYFFPLYLSDFVLLLLIGWYIRNVFTQHKQVVKKFPSAFKSILLIHFALVLLSFMHIFISGAKEIIFLSSVQLLKMAVVLSLPFLTLPKPRVDLWRYIISVTTASVFFQSVWALLQKITGGPLGRHIEAVLPGFEGGIVTSETQDLLRVNGTFYESSLLGTFLVINLLFLLVAKKNGQVLPAKLQKICGWVILLGIIALIFTGSRGLYAIFLILAGVLFKESLQLKKVLKFIQKNFLWVLLVIAIVGGYLLARVNTFNDIFTRYGTASYRIAMVKYAFRIGMAAPLGIGPNLSPQFLATSFAGEEYVFDPTYPHNIFAQIFAELGIIGAVLLLAFFYLFVRTINQNKGHYFYPVLAFIAAAQLYPIFLNHQEILGFLYFYIGMAFWEYSYAKK